MAASLAAHRPADLTRLRASLAAWRSIAPLEIGGEQARLGLLSRHLRRRPHRRGHRAADRRAAAAARRRPRARLRLRLGRDRRQRWPRMHPASRSTCWTTTAWRWKPRARTCPARGCMLGAALADAGSARYDAILSNPPLHKGLCRGPRAAGAAHRRGAGALAARRRPADRGAAPRAARPAAGRALRHRRHRGRDRPLSACGARARGHMASKDCGHPARSHRASRL